MTTRSSARVHFVYIVHGDDRFHLQTRFSVLTLLHLLLQTADVDATIHLYTDRPHDALRHPLVQVHPLDATDLRRWRGPLDYVHRIKLEVLRRAARKVGLPLLAVDGDTKWQSLPKRALKALHVEADAPRPPVYFHLFEEFFEDRSQQGYGRLLVDQAPLLKQLGLRSVGPWPSWNVGAIGVPVTAVDLFDKALGVCDALLPLTPLRRTVEQLALSLAADADFEVRALDEGLVHYWNYGIEWPMHLDKWLGRQHAHSDIESLAAACAGWIVDPIDLLALRKTLRYRLRIRRHRLRRSFQKRIESVRAWRFRLMSTRTRL